MPTDNLEPDSHDHDHHHDHGHGHGHDHDHDHDHGHSGGGPPIWQRPRAWLVALAVLAAVLFWRSFFFVDETMYIYVTSFGEPLELCTDPGLRFKWPHQSLRRFDRRLQICDPAGGEALTKDKESLNVDWYVCWRLPGRAFVEQELVASGAPADEVRVAEGVERHVLQFLQAVGTVEAAQERLAERLEAAVEAAVGDVALGELVSLDPRAVKLDTLLDLESIRRMAAEQYGIEIVDVRLKRFNYPDTVKPAVFDEIRSERARVAVRYRAEGRSEQARILSLAKKQRSQILARARSKAERIRGEGEARAMRIYNEAHGADPEFYKLLKTLETYRKMIDERTTVVLSADSPLLRLLTRGLEASSPPGEAPPEARGDEPRAIESGSGPPPSDAARKGSAKEEASP